LRIFILWIFYLRTASQLVTELQEVLGRCLETTLPCFKGLWREPTRLIYFSKFIPGSKFYCNLFASSLVQITELANMKPDGKFKKLWYYHEDVIRTPVKKCHERSFQYYYDQILSILFVSDVFFNTEFSTISFLATISKKIKSSPD
uniref:tRNA-queuosine alpha-mannosyltransferase n=1 Tax=Pongo abelii TaxID=9601 RepID=A0A8I5TB77_PONAB